MVYPKHCEECKKRFQPIGKRSKYCESCLHNRRIKVMFKIYGKYKSCKSLREALGKYGS